MEMMKMKVCDEQVRQEARGLKRRLSLNRCEVCEAEQAKYRCPNCMRLSCSLMCVKRHKQDTGCAGVRDRTAFVSVTQFSEVNLLNDYRFLEETARVADQPRRDSLLHLHPHHSFSVKLLKRNANAAKVQLKILPKSFSRRKENTSIFKKAEKKLYWHLKLHFPQSSAEYTDRVPEDRVLEEILSEYIHPTKSDPVKRQRLKLYVVSPAEQLCVFMKSEQRQPGSPRFHKLDVKKSLRENLMFKTVLEYPDLYVLLQDNSEQYLTKYPDRKSVVQSSGPSDLVQTSSRADPEPPEGPKPKKKKKLVEKMSDECELEDGEIRSEEEEEEEDQNVSVDKSLAHDEDDQALNMETNIPPSSHGGEDGDGGQDDDQMENVDDALHHDTDDQKVTTETNDPNGQDGDGQVIDGVTDQHMTRKEDQEDGGGQVSDGVTDQNLTRKEDQEDGGGQVSDDVTVTDQHMTREEDQEDGSGQVSDGVTE